MLRNDEQTDRYRSALETEKAGYEKKIAAAKVEKDDVAVSKWTSLVAEVDAELANLDGGADDGSSPLEKLAKAKNGRDLDKLAAEVGFTFEPDATTNAQKKAALEEFLSA